MALQFSVEVRNARLDAIETLIGASPIMRIRSGAVPASTVAARSGTVVATLPLPADWLLAAANGSKTLSGSWADNAADAAGTAGHFEVANAAGTLVHMQGTITATGGGGDMTLDNTVFAAGQAFSVTGFTINEPNA